jgi:Ca2+-dependent lipid-binding protein
MKIELSLNAVELKNVAGAFKGTSDPFAVVTHLATAKGQRPDVIGKTEIVKNSLSPQWTKVFTFDYELGTPMTLVVSIFDQVQKGDNKSMGSAVFDVAELLGARGNCKAKKLRTGGKIFAHVRQSTGAGTLRLQLKGLNLKNTEGKLQL